MSIRTERTQHNHLTQGKTENCPACDLIRPDVMMAPAPVLRDPYFDHMWSPIRSPVEQP